MDLLKCANEMGHEGVLLDDFKVLGSGYSRYFMRKISESLFINELKPEPDSSVVILKREDYEWKVNELIGKGIREGVYEDTQDTTQEDLHNFRTFLGNHFQKSAFYKDIWTDKNMPGRLFCTAKTHKFSDVNEIRVEGLKLRPIIDQSNTFTSNAAKLFANYLKLLQDKEYMLNDTL